jgi:hypothetical protein
VRKLTPCTHPHDFAYPPKTVLDTFISSLRVVVCIGGTKIAAMSSEMVVQSAGTTPDTAAINYSPWGKYDGQT